MTKRILNILKYILFFGIGVFIFWKIYKGEWGKVGDALKNLNYFWIGVSIVLSILSQISRAIRWNMLIRPLGYNPRLGNTFLSVLVLYLVNLIVPRGGEVARCIVLSKSEKIPFTKLVGTVFIERLADLITLVILLIIVFISQIRILVKLYNSIQEVQSSLSKLFTLKALIIGILLIVLLFTGLFLFRAIVKKNSNKESSFVIKLRELKNNVIEGIKSIAKLKNKWNFIAHSLLIFILWLFMLYVIFLAFEPTRHLSIWTGIVTFLIGGVAMILPISGGIGIWHLAVSYTLVLYGISLEDGEIFALIAHTTTNMIYIILGLIAYIWLFTLTGSLFKLSKSS
jgi:uncharacterized protein (TIRG00374 family)